MSRLSIMVVKVTRVEVNGVPMLMKVNPRGISVRIAMGWGAGLTVWWGGGGGCYRQSLIIVDSSGSSGRG